MSVIMHREHRSQKVLLSMIIELALVSFEKTSECSSKGVP